MQQMGGDVLTRGQYQLLQPVMRASSQFAPSVYRTSLEDIEKARTQFLNFEVKVQASARPGTWDLHVTGDVERDSHSVRLTWIVPRTTQEIIALFVGMRRIWLGERDTNTCTHRLAGITPRRIRGGGLIMQIGPQVPSETYTWHCTQRRDLERIFDILIKNEIPDVLRSNWCRDVKHSEQRVAKFWHMHDHFLNFVTDSPQYSRALNDLSNPGSSRAYTPREHTDIAAIFV